MHSKNPLCVKWANGIGKFARYSDSPNQCPVCGGKTPALADPQYKEYLDGLAVARSNYNKAWAKLKTLEIKKDCLQSLNKYMQ